MVAAGAAAHGVSPVCAFERQRGQLRAASLAKPLCLAMHAMWKWLPQQLEFHLLIVGQRS